MKRSKSFTIQTKTRQKSKSKPPNSVEKIQDKPLLRAAQSVPQAILKYITKRSDVEIISHYEQYKQQFFLKCKRLHQYLYKFPAMKDKYVTDQNAHFRYAFQSLMLDLYRKGVIVPESYDNLRMDAVIELQNWVLSWIQRKLLYEKVKEQEKDQIIKTCEVLNELQQFVKIIEVQQLPF